MIITCPSCAKRYLVDDTAVAPEGRDVQCIGCETRWFFQPLKEANDFNQVHLDLIGLKSSVQDNRKKLNWGWILTPSLVLLIGFSIYSNRSAIVHAYPQTTTIFQAIGLPVTQVSDELLIQKVESYQDKGKIVVRGQIHNGSKAMQQVPHLTVKIYASCANAPWWERTLNKIKSGSHGKCVASKWTHGISTPSLKPGETINFETTAPAAVKDALSVSVKF